MVEPRYAHDGLNPSIMEVCMSICSCLPGMEAGTRDVWFNVRISLSPLYISNYHLKLRGEEMDL